MINTMTPDEVLEAASKRGLGIMDLCRLANVSHSTFSRWRRGERDMMLSNYRDLVKAATGQET